MVNTFTQVAQPMSFLNKSTQLSSKGGSKVKPLEPPFVFGMNTQFLGAKVVKHHKS